MRQLAICAGITLLWAVTSSAQVRTFVSVDGVDNAQCSRISPCRTFDAAVAVVAAGGEVVALDTGGYGPTTITKSVTIHAASGTIAAIAPTAGNAITVNAPGETVIVRNLYLNAQGGVDGVGITAVGALHLEQLVVSGFMGTGILSSGPGDYDVFVKDTIIRGNQLDGANFTSAGGVARVSVDHVRVEDSGRFGIFAGLNGRVSISNSLASGHRGIVTGAGFMSGANGAVMSVHNSVSTNNNRGVVTNNHANALLFVSNSRITANGTGIFIAMGSIFSHGNNSVSGNTVDGAFTANIGAQ